MMPYQLVLALVQVIGREWTIPETVGTTVGILAILGYMFAVVFFLFRWSYLIKRMKERQDEFQEEVHELRSEMKTEFEKVYTKLDSMGIRWEELIKVTQMVENVKDRVRRLEDRKS